MLRRQVAIALLLAMSVFTAASSAQEADHSEKNEVAGTIGRMIISDQGIQGATFFDPLVRSGKGTSFQIDYARHFFSGGFFALSAEVPVVFNLDEDLISGADDVPSDYQQIFVTPSLRLNLFPTTDFSPWVSVGGGFAHFSENKNLVFGGTNPGTSSTSGVLQGGFGLDLRPLHHRLHQLGFRGEVRDFWSGEPNFPLAPTGKTRQHNFYVAGGVIWYF